jgi:hypothetical protein
MTPNDVADVVHAGPVNAGNQDVMKGRQQKEATKKNTPGVEVTPGAAEDTVVNDVVAPGDPGPSEERTQRTKPLSFADEQRNAIVENFRRRRNSEQQIKDEETEELASFMRKGGMPAEFQDAFIDDGGQNADDEAAEAERRAAEARDAEVERRAAEDISNEPAPQPKRKLKVRGKEVEYSDEEILDLARKAAAGDDYLGEARTTLDNAKAMQKELEARISQTGKLPSGENAGNGNGEAPLPDDQPQVDPYKDMAEAFLYGEPDQAASKMRSLIQSEAARIAAETITRDRVTTEHSKSLANVDRFRRANEDLASDPMAAAAIESEIVRQQRSDLLKAGIKEDKIPRDMAGVTNMHLRFRSDPRTSGFLRDTDQLFSDAKDAFLKWKGVTPTPNSNRNDQGADEQDQSEIQVSVSRDDRRRIIPQQPSRTAVVRQARPTAPPVKTRSQIIADMRKARGQPVD